ncbi:hypothetical protein D3C85_802950 [compost metagenome]
MAHGRRVDRDRQHLGQQLTEERIPAAFESGFETEITAAQTQIRVVSRIPGNQRQPTLIKAFLLVLQDARGRFPIGSHCHSHQFGVRRPYHQVSVLLHPQAEVCAIECLRQVFFVEAEHFIEDLLAHQQAVDAHRAEVLHGLLALHVTRRIQ